MSAVPPSAVDAWIAYSDAVAAQLRGELVPSSSADRIASALHVHRTWLAFMDAMSLEACPRCSAAKVAA